jgi:23S rRNA G2069 N7-methylase RlmK/C1962 C5-methylase RlmI
MTILYQDKKWLVVNKPSGISTHRAHDGDLGLVEWLALHHDLEVQICSRLDKGTSGVLVFALTSDAVAEAQAIHEEEKAKKCYYFIAKKSSKPSWICTDPLDDKPCKTHFRKINEGTVYSLYEAVILRGRTHQIRRHAAASTIPLLGDTEYGGAEFARLCLHCESVQWPDIEQTLHAPLPQWFESILHGNLEEASWLALVEKRYPFLSTVTDCHRLLHRGEFSNAMAVDKYGEWLCVTGFNETLPAQQLLNRQQDMLASLCRICGCRGGVVKTNVRDPHKNRLFADIAAWGEEIPESFLVREHDLHFSVQLNDRQHVGLFLDQRDSRRRIAKIARGKRVANLFAFTCSFSIHALAAQAEVVFSVDLAAGCLKQGRENVAINQLATTGNAKFIQEDSRKWLARQLRKKQNRPDDFTPFDLVICDPPVFASAGKGKSFHVEKEWPGLARDVSEILTNKGIALFANNHQDGSESFYYNTLNSWFSKVTRLNPPLDFPQVAGQPAHVCIYWCQK